MRIKSTKEMIIQAQEIGWAETITILPAPEMKVRLEAKEWEPKQLVYLAPA